MKGKPFVTAIVLIGIGLVMGVVLVSQFGGGSAEVVQAKATHVSDLGAAAPPVQVTSQAEALNDAFVAVSDAVAPQVVSIAVMSEEEQQSWFGSSAPREAGGSGVIISDDGYIVTNHHVVEGAAEDGIRVIGYDRQEYNADLIGSDELTDIAVLKIEGANFHYAFFGNSDDVKVGQWVVAVGNPLGLRSTITAGILSAIGRGRLGLNSDSYAVENFLQTDAAINPGNSGGGLFDLRGQLIGINTAIASRTGYYSGYGFAIPSNLVRSVVNDLIEDGEVNRGYIGVSIKSIDAADAKALGLNKVQGVLVQSVMDNSAGEEAGMRQGDVILQVDGREVLSSQDLQSIVATHRAGDKVKLSVWRNDQLMEKTVRLKPRDGSSIAEALPGEPPKDEMDPAGPIEFDDLGITVEPLTAELADQLDVDYGVVVTKVDPRSTVARSRKIVRGDVIVKADWKDIKTPRALEEIISAKKPGSAVLLQLSNQGATRIEGVEIPETNP